MTALWTEPDQSRQSQAAGILEQELGNQVLPLALAPLHCWPSLALTSPASQGTHRALWPILHCQDHWDAIWMEATKSSHWWETSSAVSPPGSSSVSHLSHCLDANPWTTRSMGGEMGCRKHFILQWDWGSWQSLTQQCSKILVKCDYAFKEQIPSVHLNWAFPLLSHTTLPQASLNR